MIIQSDILEWAATYSGEPFHALLQSRLNSIWGNMDIVLPKDEKIISIIGRPIRFFMVICNVTLLNSRKIIGIIEARIGVPERSVNLNQGIAFWQVKVINKAPKPILLNVIDAQCLQDGGEGRLQSIIRFACSAFGYLLRCQGGVISSRFFAGELAAACLSHLLYCFWGMGSAIHAILSALPSLASRWNLETLHTLLNGTLRQSIASANGPLTHTFINIKVCQYIFAQMICFVTQHLSIAVCSSRYTQPIHSLSYSWNGNAKMSGDVF